jgi:hypothetical protein
VVVWGEMLGKRRERGNDHYFGVEDVRATEISRAPRVPWRFGGESFELVGFAWKSCNWVWYHRIGRPELFAMCLWHRHGDVVACVLERKGKEENKRVRRGGRFDHVITRKRTPVHLNSTLQVV